MRIRTIVIALAASVGLAACGDTAGEQALIGGTVGAGAAVVAGSSIAAGAAVGAAGNLVFCQTYPSRCN